MPRKVQEMAAWAVSRSYDDLSRESIPYLKVLVLDTLGCAIGALKGEPVPCRVTILLRDGRELVIERSDYDGFWRTRPLGWEAALGKFERLCEGLLDRGLGREIPEAVSALDSIPVRELTELLGG